MSLLINLQRNKIDVYSPGVGLRVYHVNGPFRTMEHRCTLKANWSQSNDHFTLSIAGSRRAFVSLKYCASVYSAQMQHVS